MKASTNQNWGSGPWGDWIPSVDLPDDSPHIEFYDDALPTTACGYIAVPAS
jgi:hypothetical protein